MNRLRVPLTRPQSACPTGAFAGCILPFVAEPEGPVEPTIAVYLLPLALFAVAVALIAWGVKRRDRIKLEDELEAARRLAQQREGERDLAQEELFRRLYEEREWNKEKTQFQAQLAEYEKYAALAQLALGAAHEINNPLLGILSHLELELRSAEGERRTEIEQCIDGAKRISATLRGLLNYARPGPLVLSRISLKRLISDTVAFLRNQPILGGKHLEAAIAGDLPLIRADANQLSQVLMNLLLNAAEATPEGGRISVSAARLALVDAIEIQVRDTGCGIPPDILAHVFEPFFTTKRGKGTGLGLSISQAYIRSHNGEIRVDSVAGHGTTVTITLPATQAAEIADDKEAAEMVVH